MNCRKAPRDVLLRRMEALEVENAKLKQQLMSTKLEKWVLQFSWYSDVERDAVRRCYEYIGNNYDGWLVWEDFVTYYVDQKEMEMVKGKELEFWITSDDLPF